MLTLILNGGKVDKITDLFLYNEYMFFSAPSDAIPLNKNISLIHRLYLY